MSDAKRVEPQAGRVAFPLRVSDDGRHLVDAESKPFLLHGDTAWSILVGTDKAGAVRYLDDRRERGFTAVVVNLIERLFSPDPPRNVFGDAPFADERRLVGPDPAYFAHARWFVEEAAKRDMLVLLAPAYLGYATPHYPGYDGAEEGWYEEVLATPVEACAEYGRFVGRLFAETPNVLWVMSGDRNPGAAIEHVRAIARAIMAARPGSLFTPHVHPGDKGVEQFPGDEWLNVSQTYSYDIVHRALLQDYERTPARPNFLFETSYEGEHNASALQIRRQAYWALTCGAFGQVYGAYPLWMTGPGWEASLDSQGARDMRHVPRLFDGLPWWELVPDRDHELVVDGRGEFRGLDLCTVARTADRRLAVGYLPAPRPIALDLRAMAGPEVRMTWYSPITGERLAGGRFDAAGRVELMPPRAHDWAFVLESGAGS